jgi:hypothetical protein
MGAMDEMERVRSPYTVSNKRDVLFAALVWNVVATIAVWISTGDGPVYAGVAIFQTVGNSVATLVWCHIDAVEHGVTLGPGFRLLILLFGPLIFFYYMPKSRGFKGGVIAIGRACGFLVVLILVTSMVNIVLALISDRMGLFAAP